uniref:Uncharacterized protein n=1 Tax=Tanacetum cinerariifolium TaxID=118510 RepID=A0A6L2LJ01_TANCI|nr:hypothetical protein [Tanacetum cinerariifolium]
MSKRSRRSTRGEASSSQAPSILKKNPLIQGISFRFGGETRTMPLLEFGWRGGLYDEEVASHEDTIRTLCRIIALDILYMYCIYSVGVICNISFWLAHYLKKVRTMNVLYGGMFGIKISRSFGLLGGEMIKALSVEPGTPRALDGAAGRAMGALEELDDPAGPTSKLDVWSHRSPVPVIFDKEKPESS